MQVATIKLSWIGCHPTRRMDAHYWVEVVECLVASGHDPETATDLQVRAAIAEIEARTISPAVSEADSTLR